VNSENGHSTRIALDMLSNHLRVASGILEEEHNQQLLEARERPR
jgi:hypothetical protein